MRILCWTQTDVGQKRDHNEDSFLVAADVGLYVVADGMGGHAGGDQASQMAVSSLHDAVRRAHLSESVGSAGLSEEPLALSVLRQAAQAAGELIFDLAQQNAHLSGMGTTLTALLFNGGRVHLAHVGDSRAYLFRDGRIEQLSEDHSWINEQVKAGLITDEEAKHSKFKHIITRSVGFEREVSVDVMSLPVLMGDCFLICSDGLSNYLETDEIGRLLTSGYYARVPSLLVDLANERGGDDNITVVLVYVANDSGPPLVEDLSKPDPCRATTHPGPDPTQTQSNASPLSEPTDTPPKAATPATQQAGAPATQQAEAPATPQADAPATPQAEAPPEATTPQVEAPATPQANAPQAATAPARGGAPGVPGQTIDPLADTAPADLSSLGKGSGPKDPPADSATPVISTDEPTPEAGLPAAPKPEDPS